MYWTMKSWLKAVWKMEISCTSPYRYLLLPFSSPNCLPMKADPVVQASYALAVVDTNVLVFERIRNHRDHAGVVPCLEQLLGRRTPGGKDVLVVRAADSPLQAGPHPLIHGRDLGLAGRAGAAIGHLHWPGDDEIERVVR